MATIRELSHREDRLEGGHRLCAGCGASIAVRQVLLGAGLTPVVAGCATGCLEVSTTIYPYSSWKVPFIHNAFENSAATVSRTSIRRSSRPQVPDFASCRPE